MGSPMRLPEPDERQVALMLLENVELSADARAIVQRISRGELVQNEALVLLRSLAEVRLQRGRTDPTKLA